MNETAAEYRVEKSAWRRGPWDNEPDKVQWVHASGLDCLMVRGERHGAWCGYVGVPVTHPAYGKRYDNVDCDVHGGLTYADKYCGNICHVPEPGRPDDVWWLGFDCGHAWDLMPGMEASLRQFDMLSNSQSNDVYRDQSYALSECNQLATQLAAMK